MAQNIELEKVGVKGVIVKMRRLPFGIHIIGRILYRCNVFNLDVIRYDDYAAGMLPCVPLDAGTAGRQTA